MIDRLTANLVEVTGEVLNTMVDWKVEPVGPVGGDCRPTTFELSEVNGWVGFCGKMTGSLFFSCEESVASRLAGKLLGEDCGPSETSDVIGELTNMLAGGCKSRLCDQGLPVVISIPNIIRGVSLRAAGRDVVFMIRVPFAAPEQQANFQVTIQGKLVP